MMELKIKDFNENHFHYNYNKELKMLIKITMQII